MCILSFTLSFEYEHLLKMAKFPPDVPDVPGEPRGHKKPLGWQRPPEGPVKEYTKPLNANEFWKLHVRDHIPLVYRGYIKDSPAIKLWNDEYLTKTYGDLDVLVEHKREDRTSSSGRMRLADFIKNYKEQDLYVVTMFPSDMMHEVRAIPSVLCGTFRNYTHESNLWISAGGTRSVVHYDADHNVHCVIDGRKDFIMINNNFTTKTNLYFKYKDPGVGSGFSFLDPDSIDMHKFKKIYNVPWTYASLYPGDCIFIPSVYIHQVRGYGRTLAVTTLFTADVKNEFNGDDCTDEIMTKYHSMADIKFQWTYKKGDQTIDMGYMNVYLVKKSLREGLKDDAFTKNGKFTKKQFVVYAGVFSPYGRNKTKIANIWTEVFKFKDDTLLDEALMDTLNLEQWKIFCRAVEAPHGVVTNGTEPVYVRPGERHKWETEHPDDDDDAYMTEDERHRKSAANKDPMLAHLSEEEKADYLKKKKEEKAKFDVNYEPDDEELDDSDWRSELGWSLDDLPRKYQKSIIKGKIPKEFHEEFVSNLPDAVREKYGKILDKYEVPQEILRVLKPPGDEGYRVKATRELNKNDNEEDDGMGEDDFEAGPDMDGDETLETDDEGPEAGGDGDMEEPDDEANHIPMELDDLDVVRQRRFLSGKISKGDIEDLLSMLPESFKQYEKDIKKGIVPDAVLMDLIRSDEENFAEDVAQWKKVVKKKSKKEKKGKKKARDEL